MLQVNNKLYIEVGSFQHNKHGNIVCGDSVLMHKSIKENRTIAVLSDEIGRASCRERV